MALSLIDPNTVTLIGENCILKLQQDEGGPAGTLASFWRVLHSPAGAGHVLMVRSDVLDGVRIFSETAALARFIQTLEKLMRPEFADPETKVEFASFSRQQSGDKLYQERLATGDGEIVLEWRNLGVPFMTRLEPNNRFVGTWSVYSCLVPASEAKLTAFGREASGRAFPDTLEGTATSTSFLALGEIWLAPRTS